MRISVLVVFAALALFAVAVTESAAQVSAPGGPSTFFRVRGRVEHPKVYRLASRARCWRTSSKPPRHVSTPTVKTTFCVGARESTPRTTTR
jgi:hypothetical protein